MAKNKRKKLLLFDIDGTLLTTDRKAFEIPFSEAIREVLGVEVDTVSYRAGGKTDPQMIHELLSESGLSHGEVEAAIPHVRDRYLEKLPGYIRSERDVVLKPGVGELLERLSAEEEAILGLITGNFETGARLKLGVHGLNRFFPFGAFGDGALDRLPLPGRAVEAARKKTGIVFGGKDVVVIGDTPHDVRCGKPLGARTVAVATGLYSQDILGEEVPDWLFGDLADTDSVLDALLAD